MRPLNVKQKRFCNEYLIDSNGAQAAIRAGYSKKAAKEIACELLTKPHITDYIQKKQAKIDAKLEITQDRIRKEYARLAFLDVRKAYDDEGNLKPIQAVDDDTAAAIAGLDMEDGKIRRLRLADKKGALDSLAKHFGMFVDKTEVSVSMTEETAALLRGRARIASQDG